jgi:glycosyltransferase involved in cell wall biosynthesis
MNSSFQRPTWHLLTGEYPPAPGGVSDYTRSVARALAAAGDAVEVWAPACGGEAARDPGVRVNWLNGNFGPAALNQLEHGLRRRSEPRVILLQYVPHAFGWKAMNLWLVHWLYRMRRRERIWILFHEVCFPHGWGRPWRHNFLSTIQRWMAREIARIAKRRFVTTPQWMPLLHSFGHLPRTTEWLPVPSNIAMNSDAQTTTDIRAKYRVGDGSILGHFGTFSDIITSILTEPLLAALRKDSRRTALLLGRGGQEYARRLCVAHPDLSHRIAATGDLDSTSLANHLAACDLLLQPFPDGASTRRSSLMACAALGLPIVTSRDTNTESVWSEYDAVCLVENTPTAWTQAIEDLLARQARRFELGLNAHRLYRDRFAVERTVECLQARYRESNEIDLQKQVGHAGTIGS